MERVPKRLNRDPIVEALCEIRFEPTENDVAPLLLGAMFNLLKVDFPQHAKLPSASLPNELKASVPDMAFAPQYRLKGDNCVVHIGDKALSVAVQYPYPGWSNFRPLILRTLRTAIDSGLLGIVNRMSLRYTNRLDLDSNRPLSAILRTSLALGDSRVSDKPMVGPDRSALMLRYESRADGLVSIIQVGWPAKFALAQKSIPDGLAVDVDVIADSLASKNFRQEFESLLDAIHATEKAKFFSLLTPETVASYEPEY